VSGGAGRAARALACAWGFAEATVFFIVPDVGLTFLALRGLRRSLGAAAWALGGALAGGAAMLLLGARAPGAALRLLDALPGISPALLEHAHRDLEVHGLRAVLLGVAGGIPYKIYAVEWGAGHGAWLPFLLVSVPARGARFLVTPLVAAGLQRLAAPLTGRRALVEWGLLAAFWLGFYGFYFSAFRG
jgi:hypothetical protein